ncbi:MAG TPA: threonine/serine dehydratase [Geminicoccus sp.]|nr:threonine/serine dehydratase [Geminicoccus sp.]HWL70757.1 threonine/serine dehydratase [Geminicoccus sp.]
MPPIDDLPLSIDQIQAAAASLDGLAVRTPLLESPLLNARLGGRLLVKAECLQRTGSFKFRGAYNAVTAAGGKPVVAFSSGNHAQGVAHAAQILGVPATIIMPADAPRTKLDNTRAYGATVVTYDRWNEDREAIGAGIARDQGAVLVRPYDDPRVMAGQGTVGLEIAGDCLARDIRPDCVLVPASGGGLAAGVATAIQASLPATAIMTAEPAGFDDHARSLAAGERTVRPEGGTTICDALMAKIPGELTFQVNRRRLAGGTVADDRAVRAAMLTAFRYLKLVVEPGGAVGLAAVLAGAVPVRDRTVVVVLSGGNVDASLFADVLNESADA